jgi:hypothetical protein
MGFPLVFRVHDRKIMQRSMMETKHREWTNFTGIHQSIREVSRFQFSELCEVCSGQTLTPKVQTVDDRMEDEPPSRLNSWVKLHVPSPTHVSHEATSTPSCMHSLFHTLELHALPLLGLRIKTYLSHHFGIIINYYS